MIDRYKYDYDKSMRNVRNQQEWDMFTLFSSPYGIVPTTLKIKELYNDKMMGEVMAAMSKVREPFWRATSKRTAIIYAKTVANELVDRAGTSVLIRVYATDRIEVVIGEMCKVDEAFKVQGISPIIDTNVWDALRMSVPETTVEVVVNFVTTQVNRVHRYLTLRRETLKQKAVTTKNRIVQRYHTATKKLKGLTK